ncbi:hypothetical protein Nepgr_013513 [Nepenthes gracilis]|uniref:Uncharacterized protein n=1 Tax=Nepenthes gracilis TaxID=150966 RepID=A0AAD3SJA0_NEPGR|nr:hypothetical protein Nepgr_013513 [Nepenthes gracilis]
MRCCGPSIVCWCGDGSAPELLILFSAEEDCPGVLAAVVGAVLALSLHLLLLSGDGLLLSEPSEMHPD